MTFWILQKSEANIEVVDEEDTMISRTVKAIIHIFDAHNLTVHALLRGHIRINGFTYFPFRTIKRNQKKYDPKSITLVYEHSSWSSKNRLVSIGERQPGDALLFQQSKVAIKHADRMASSDFQFEDDTKSITSVDFMFDVSGKQTE